MRAGAAQHQLGAWGLIYRGASLINKFPLFHSSTCAINSDFASGGNDKQTSTAQSRKNMKVTKTVDYAAKDSLYYKKWTITAHRDLIRATHISRISCCIELKLKKHESQRIERRGVHEKLLEATMQTSTDYPINRLHPLNLWHKSNQRRQWSLNREFLVRGWGIFR